MIRRLRHGDLPFTMLLVDTVEAIRDPAALGLWCYLQSKSENWIIRQKQLCDHFEIGRHKCRAAVKRLKEEGLWTEEVEKGADGRIVGIITTIHYKRTESLEITVRPETRRTENPSDGKPPTTKQGVIPNKEKNQISISGPDFISKSVWAGWLSYRSERGWPMTKTSTRMLVVKLESARAAGATPAELEAEIDTAIERGWRTVYPAALQKQPQRKKDWI